MDEAQDAYCMIITWNAYCMIITLNDSSVDNLMRKNIERTQKRT
jgi:hypothetical protein